MRLIYADKLLEKMSCHCDVCQYHSHRKRTCCGECDWHEAMDDVPVELVNKVLEKHGGLSNKTQDIIDDFMVKKEDN